MSKLDREHVSDPVHEARIIFDMTTRESLTVDQARELIGISEGAVSTLQKIMPKHRFADAVRQRAAIRAAFERLIEASRGPKAKR